MRLNSVIFHTDNLPELRAFYEGVLGFPTGTYVKDGKAVPDHSDTYVNYHLAGGLLCFEEEDGAPVDIGTVVINVEDFAGFRARVEKAGIEVKIGSPRFFMIEDPEGRSLIIEPM